MTMIPSREFPFAFNALLGAVLATTLAACDDADPDCDYNGRNYAVGDEFEAADGCNRCSCSSSGEIVCTRAYCLDGGFEPADGGIDASSMCPVTAEVGGACSGSAHCEYGEESCCGETYPSTVCDCSGGTFSCYATDACFRPPGSCGDSSLPHEASTPDDAATRDGGNGCPAEPPIGLTCTGSAHCEFDTETCCGKTYPSTVCDCQSGNWGCYATDACLLPPGACDGGA